MSEMTNDGAMIAASVEDPERFGGIFDRYYAQIHQFAHRRLGPEHAEDIAAEVFIQAFNNRRRFDRVHESARPWLYGIATNLIRMHARSEKRMLRAYAKSGADPFEDFTAAAAERASASGQRKALMAAVSELSRTDRDVLLLSAWSELSSKEIGIAIGMPDATVRTRLARSRAKLTAALADVEDLPELAGVALAEETTQ